MGNAGFLILCVRVCFLLVLVGAIVYYALLTLK